jgi:hypothetical protein
MTTYFLLSSNTEKIVCENKEQLLKKADEIISKILFIQSQITGPSYHYEKVIENDEYEYRFILRSRNCNSILQQDKDELVCTIIEVKFLSSTNNDKKKPESSVEEVDKEEKYNDDQEESEKKDFIMVSKKEE